MLLSAIFGIESRNTRDIDISIKGIDVSKEKMVNVLNEILSINLRDHVKFEVVKITDIRTDHEYGGNKYRIVGKLENLVVPLEIDISTGDEMELYTRLQNYWKSYQEKYPYADNIEFNDIVEKLRKFLGENGDI